MKNKIIKDLIWILASLTITFIIMEFIEKKRCRIFQLDDGEILHIIQYENKTVYYKDYECPICNKIKDLD